VALGLVLVASAAATPAAGRWGRPPADYVLRQAAAAAAGLALLAAIVGLGRRRVEAAAWPLAALLLAASAATLVPGVGLLAGGARRDLPVLPGLSVQPTALFAAATPLLLARALAAGGRRLALAWVLVGLELAVCAAQPNFGHLATILAAAVGALVGWGRGARRQLAAAAGALALAPVAALAFPYVRWRLASFLDPSLTRDTQALAEIAAAAGPLGAGLERGVAKGLLSAAPTDYVLAVTLEELGWLGAGATLALLVLLCAAVARVGLAGGGDPVRRAAAVGAAASLAFPAAVHAGVCLRLVPVTGIHLPLLSASGSAVVAALLALAVPLAQARPDRVESASGGDR